MGFLDSLVNRQSEMLSVAFGGEERERVEIQVHGYERTPVGESYDDNWVNVSVLISVGAFAGKYDATFLTSDFIGLRAGLQALHESLEGTASFSTLEDQLSLKFTGDGRGHIALKGLATDAPGTGNRLEFELALDQTYLPSALGELNEIVRSFPVRAG